MMETVADVMESIRDVKSLIEFINAKESESTKEGKEHEADTFGDVALVLGDYIGLLKRMKLKEAF